MAKGTSRNGRHSNALAVAKCFSSRAPVSDAITSPKFASAQIAHGHKEVESDGLASLPCALQESCHSGSTKSEAWESAEHDLPARVDRRGVEKDGRKSGTGDGESVALKSVSRHEYQTRTWYLKRRRRRPGRR